MTGLDPARMPRRVVGDLVAARQKRNRVRRVEACQIDIPEENDIGIEDAIALAGQFDAGGDLENLLDVPAAHGPCPQRPPELPSLAPHQPRQRVQPGREKPGGRQHDPARVGERGEQVDVGIRHQEIVRGE